MKKILFMFTNNYPYGTGEAFIENEILISSSIYENIYIYVMNKQNDKVNMRTVPENVEIISIRNLGKFQKFFWAFVHALSGIFSGDLLCEWKKCKAFCEYKKSLSFYLASKERYVQIKNCDIKPKGIRVDLYCYWFLESVYVAGLMKQRILPDSVLITRAHRYDLYAEKTSYGYFPFRKQMLEHVDRVCPCSIDGEKYLKNQYPDVAKKICYSYLGTKDVLTQLKEPNKDSLVIVTCSNIIPVKRVIRVAETLSMLECEGIKDKIEWYCFGDGGLRGELEQYCNKNLRNIRTFFMGQTANEDILKFYNRQNVDLFINVSESEGLPVSIMEAASFGIPTIATDVGGSSEIVIDGVNGFLISKNFTNEDLKNIITKYISLSHEQKINLKENARKHWEKNFSADNNYPQFFQQYDELSE